MSKKKKANKKIRDAHGSITLKELEDQGLVPKDFHLFDGVEMKEWHAK